MSDIIKDAKQLLDGATPGPWEVDIDGLEVYSTVDGDAVAHVQTPSDADLIAAAPELAQALAEETYEYGVEYKYLTNHGAEWRLDPGVGWHETYRAAERAASASVRFRIVRRRVSPVEVISD